MHLYCIILKVLHNSGGGEEVTSQLDKKAWKRKTMFRSNSLKQMFSSRNFMANLNTNRNNPRYILNKRLPLKVNKYVEMSSSECGILLGFVNIIWPRQIYCYICRCINCCFLMGGRATLAWSEYVSLCAVSRLAGINWLRKQTWLQTNNVPLSYKEHLWWMVIGGENNLNLLVTVEGGK